MPFKASESLYNFIKQQEDFRSEPYTDPAGIKTVGYGSADNVPDRAVTREEAERMLRDRVSVAEKEMAEMIPRSDLTQSQQDALIDMHYNLGKAKLEKSGLVELIKAGRDDEVASKILQYNKYRDPETGELKVLPGLENRANQRAAWWNNKESLQVSQSGDLPLGEEMEDIMAELDKYDETRGVQPQVSEAIDLDEPASVLGMEDGKELLRKIDQFQAAGVISPDNIDARIRQLNGARDVFTKQDSERTALTKKLSAELGIDPLAIDSDLETKTEQQIRAKYSIPEIARDFPEISKWAAQPDNYVILENNPDWTRGLTQQFRKLNPDGDEFEDAFSSALLTYKKGQVYGEWLSGTINSKKAEEKLKKIEQEQVLYTPSAKTLYQLKNTGRKTEVMSKELGDVWDSLGDTVGAYTNPQKKALIGRELVKLAKESGEGIASVWDWMVSMYENPEAAKVTLGALFGSSTPPIVTGVVGSLGATPVAGGLGAWAIATIGAVGGKVEEDLSELKDKKTGRVLPQYRDEITGGISLEKIARDKAQMNRLRKRAITYGPTIAISDAIYAGVAGKFFFKAVKKQGAKAALKGVVTEAAVEGGTEGAGEFTASTLADAVSDGVTPESLGKATAKSLEEALGGTVVGGTAGAAAGSARFLLNPGRLYDVAKKANFKKAKNVAKKTNKAFRDMVNLHQASKLKDSEEGLDNVEENVKDLIDETTGRRKNPYLPPLPDEANYDPEGVDIEEDIDSEEKIDSLQITSAQEASQGTVSVSPRELVTFFDDRNEDFMQAISDIPEEYRQEIAESIEDDFSVTIPMSDIMMTLRKVPELVEILRINDNDINAREAGDIQQDFENNQFELFQEDGLPPPLPEDQVEVELEREELPPIPEPEGEQPPAIPTEVERPMEERESIAEDSGSLIISLDEIRSNFRSTKDQRAFTKFNNKLNRALKNVKGVPKDAVNVFAQIAFQRMKTRAEATERDIDDLVSELKFSNKKKPGARGVFSPLFKKIFIDKSLGNATVLVHEFGHSWLDELSQDYQFMANIPFENMTQVQKDYWYSMQKAAEVLEIDNIGLLDSNGLPEGERVKLHETFAQTTERYFLDGYFGDNKVRAAMESFRKYMVSLMEEILDYFDLMKDRYPTLEITPSIERMFDGIIGVDNVIEDNLPEMFPDPSVPTDALNAKTEQAYFKYKDSLMVGVGKFASKIANMSFKKREGIIDKALNVINDEAIRIIESMPEMILDGQFQDAYREYRDRKSKGQQVSDPRISYKSFLDLFDGDETAADIAKAQIPTYVVAGKKKGGVDAEVVMNRIGLTTAEDFVNTLMTFKLKDQLIQTEANKLIDEKFPILKSDEAIRKEVIEAFDNDATQKILRDSLKDMAQNQLTQLRNLTSAFITPPEVMRSNEYIKSKAREKVMKSYVHNFNPLNFRRDYGRLGKEVAVLMSKGDIAAAYETKVRQTIAYEAYKMARGAERELLKARQNLKLFQNPQISTEDAKEYNYEFLNWGLAVAKAASQNTSLPRINAEMIPDYIPMDNAYIMMANALVQGIESKSGGRLGTLTTVETQMMINETLRWVRKISKDIATQQTIDYLGTIDELGNNIADRIRNSESPSLVYDNFTSRKQNYLETARVLSDQIYNVFVSLAGGEEQFALSPEGQIFRAVEDGEASANLKTREELNIINSQALAKIAKASKNSTFERVVEPLTSRVPFIGPKLRAGQFEKPIVDTGIEGVKFNNLSEFLMAELIMGSPSGAEKLMRGGFNGSKSIAEYDLNTGELDLTKWRQLRQRLVDKGILKKEHYDALQVIWDVLREKHKPLQEEFRKTDGFPIGKIEGWKVDTPFGQYDGGYVPIAKEEETITTFDKDNLFDVDHSRLAAFGMMPSQNTGSTLSRNQSYFDVKLDMNRIGLYIKAANDIIYMRQAMRDFSKIMKHPAVVEALEEKRPGARSYIIAPWFDRVLNQRRVEKGDPNIDSLVNKVRRGINTAIYAGQLSTIFKQPLGLLTSMIDIRPDRIIKYAMISTLRPQATTEYARQNSQVLNERWDATVRKYVNDYEGLVQNFDWVESSKDLIERYVVYGGIQIVQNRVDTATALAAYDQFKARNPQATEEQAWYYANRIVKSTQSDFAVSQLNNAQTKSTLVRFIMGMATSIQFALNNKVATYYRSKPLAIKHASMTLAVGFTAFMAQSVLDQVLGIAAGAISGDDDEALEEKLDNIAMRSILGGLAPMAPIVGQVPAGLFYGGNITVAPSISMVDRSLRGTYSFGASLAEGDDVSLYELRSMLTMFTIYSGIPLNVVTKNPVLKMIEDGLE